MTINERVSDEMDILRDKAVSLYKPPFRFEHGYILDAESRIVADNNVEDVDGAALRVRGWGRISYMENAEALQDEVGGLIAQAMTEFWQQQYRAAAEPVAFTEAHEISNMRATGLYLRAWPADRERNEAEGYTIPLYAAPQVTSVPDAVDYSDLDATSQDREIIEAIAECKGWNACRAAMLNGGKS